MLPAITASATGDTSTRPWPIAAAAVSVPAVGGGHAAGEGALHAEACRPSPAPMPRAFRPPW